MSGVPPREDPRSAPGRSDFTDLLRLWQIDDAVLARLKACRPITEKVLGGLGERFYRPLFAEEPVRLLMRDRTVRERAVAAMTEHFRDLLSGDLRQETLLRAVLVGRRHQELGVGAQYLLVLCQRVLELLIKAVIAAPVAEPAATIDAIVRIIRFSNAISLQAQAEAGSATAAQHATLRLREDLQTLEDLAYVDALTGLFNRRYFNQSLAAAVAHALRHQEPLCLVMADVDHFKRVNDLHGHLAGDRALQVLAEAMAHVVRADDILARFGGEEFAVILPSTVLDQAIHCAERLRATAEALPVVWGDQAPIRFTMSLGVAMFRNRETSDSLVRAADAALYAAKRNGRNRISVRPGETARTGSR